MLHRFYPIVPNAAWVSRIVPLGVKSVQLRIKDAAADVAAEIEDALEVCERHGAQLIVNDFWREAIRCGAGFVHLGQDDLKSADLSAIRAAGLKLGISTHDHAELNAALAAQPHYVALGPIYETKLKAMPWQPQGLPRIGEWKQLAGELPIVAIGGITLERAPEVFRAGADSIAVVTDIVAHPQPEHRVAQWLEFASRPLPSAAGLAL